jgi:hypothetical protein
MLLVTDEPPHADAEDVLALLQSTPPELGAVYEGVIIGCDVMLFIPMAGLFCCWEKVGLPIPGLAGLMAGKEELRDEKVLLLCNAGTLVGGGGETGGVDHEKVAGAGEALLDLFAGREGRAVGEVCIVAAIRRVEAIGCRRAAEAHELIASSRSRAIGAKLLKLSCLLLLDA